MEITTISNLINISALRLLAQRELRTFRVAGGMQVYSVAGGMQVYSVAGGMQVYSVTGGMQVYYVAGGMQVYYVTGGMQVYYVTGGMQVYSVTNYNTCCFLLHLQLSKNYIKELCWTQHSNTAYLNNEQTDEQTDNNCDLVI